MIPTTRPTPQTFEVPRLSERVLRASPAYDLVPHRTLPRVHRATFAVLAKDPDHFGLLVPSRRTELGVKSVDNNLATLFTQLLEPRSPGETAGLTPDDHTLLKLIVDGVLEVETSDGFTSGPGACAALNLPTSHGADGPLAQLSKQALRLAFHHPTTEPTELSAWIYRFGALPANAQACSAFGTLADQLESLGISPGTSRRDRLCRAYSHSQSAAWSSWEQPSRGVQHLPYKLYISPHPRDLGTCFGGVIDALVSAQVPAFKFGLGTQGMLRPDRMVVYLADWQDLHDIAVRLADVLGGARPHGVPFTAALGGGGCLSWGMDPPRHAAIEGWGPGESWRSWVANRAARALLIARGAACNTETALSFATARLLIEGVDIATWTPCPSLWDSEDPR